MSHMRMLHPVTNLFDILKSCIPLGAHRYIHRVWQQAHELHFIRRRGLPVVPFIRTARRRNHCDDGYYILRLQKSPSRHHNKLSLEVAFAATGGRCLRPTENNTDNHYRRWCCSRSDVHGISFPGILRGAIFIRNETVSETRLHKQHWTKRKVMDTIYIIYLAVKLFTY